jgi:hypothetical protein
VLLLDTLRLGAGWAAADTLRLCNGSCQCLLTIVSILLGSCFGFVIDNTIAAVGDTIEKDLTYLTSGPASFVYDTSSLSAFVHGSFRIFVPAVTFSDESATASVSVEEISNETSGSQRAQPAKRPHSRKAT